MCSANINIPLFFPVHKQLSLYQLLNNPNLPYKYLSSLSIFLGFSIPFLFFPLPEDIVFILYCLNLCSLLKHQKFLIISENILEYVLGTKKNVIIICYSHINITLILKYCFFCDFELLIQIFSMLWFHSILIYQIEISDFSSFSLTYFLQMFLYIDIILIYFYYLKEIANYWYLKIISKDLFLMPSN